MAERIKYDGYGIERTFGLNGLSNSNVGTE